MENYFEQLFDCFTVNPFFWIMRRYYQYFESETEVVCNQNLMLRRAQNFHDIQKVKTT